MISGDTRRLVQYRNQLPKAIYQCLEKLSHFDFGAVPDAKVQLGEYTMSVESPSTEPKEERKLEGHEKFIDVVFLIRGEEIIGIRDLALGGKRIESHPDSEMYPLYWTTSKGVHFALYE
jgi:biofilm protein TabA